MHTSPPSLLMPLRGATPDACLIAPPQDPTPPQSFKVALQGAVDPKRTQPVVGEKGVEAPRFA